MKSLYGILLFLLISCSEIKEQESYEIYNTVLHEYVSTYGIAHQYDNFDGDSISHKKSLDSLKYSNTLLYYISPSLQILDTLNLENERPIDESIIFIEISPNYSQNKLNFSKLKPIWFAKRVSEPLPIKENGQQTYLGDYELSEPLFNKTMDKAQIKYEHHCGSKCGVGLRLYLEKTIGKWKIAREELIWIS